jgi:hypothetical protein
MLPAPAAPRKRSARPSCFRPPPFDGRHPDWLRLDASPPPITTRAGSLLSSPAWTSPP